MMIGTKAALTTVALAIAGLALQAQAADLNVSSYGGADAAAYRAA